MGSTLWVPVAIIGCLQAFMEITLSLPTIQHVASRTAAGCATCDRPRRARLYCTPAYKCAQLLRCRCRRQDQDCAVVLREPSPVRPCFALSLDFKCVVSCMYLISVCGQRRMYDYENFVWAVQLPKVRTGERVLRVPQQCAKAVYQRGVWLPRTSGRPS